MDVAMYKHVVHPVILEFGVRSPKKQNKNRVLPAPEIISPLDSDSNSEPGPSAPAGGEDEI
jgi:hypothetical protein